MRVCITLFFLLFLLGCSEEKIEYEVQFELSRFEMKQFEFYNPIENLLKLDSISRAKYSDYYYDAYYDKNGTLRYLYYKCSSYGYLQELYYTESLQLSNVIIYPILADCVDEGASLIYNRYFYVNGKLVALRDNFDDTFLIVDEDSVTVYEGILNISTDFKIRKLAISDYYISYLISLPTGLDSTSSVE